MSPARLLRSLVRPSAARAFHSTPRNMVVHHAKTAEEFKAALKNDRVIVDCFAEWCGPCKAIAPYLARYSEEEKELSDIHFLKIDVDEVPELSQELGIRAMPTFLFFKKGEKVDEMIGASPPQLLAKLKELAAN